jgi:NitT/TauT family transport system permease protein
VSDYVVVDGVRKVYGAGARALEAVSLVSFSARTGEFISILGPSGCGKSTLLMMVAGLEPVTAGRIAVDGRLVTGPRAGTGVIFQDPVLLPWKSVVDNVLFPIRILRRPVDGFRQRAAELLDAVGLAEFHAKRPHQLSGGMRQRAAICRALIHDPALLLMDEPFSALDAMTRDEMNALLMDIWHRYRKTVLFVTHSIREAVFLSDRVLVMARRPSTIIADVGVPLPRPRDLSIEETPAFNEQRLAMDRASAADLGAGRMDSLTAGLRAGMAHGVRPIVLPVATALAGLVAWEAAVRWSGVPEAILPAPTDVARTLVSAWDLLLEHTWPTAMETVGGFLLATVVGIAVAIAITYSAPVREALYPLLVVFQLIPKVALAPLFIVWLGIGSASRLAFALFISFFPIVISTAAGLVNADRTMLRLARSLTATEWQVFVSIRFPGALPHIFSGLKIAVTLSIIGVIVGEFITAQAGLGYLIVFATSRAETAAIMAAIVVLCVVGLVLYGLVGLAERLVLGRFRGDA